MAQTINPPLLGMAALAEYLGVSLATVRRWRLDGYGPTGFPVGRHVKYRRADVDAWIDAQAGAA